MPAQSIYQTLCDKSTARLVSLFDCCSKVAHNDANDSDSAVNDDEADDEERDDHECDAFIGNDANATVSHSTGTVVRVLSDSVGKRLAYYGACPCNGRRLTVLLFSPFLYP